MLVRATPLIGLDVISVNTGEKIEKVEDVMYDPRRQRVTGLLVDEAGFFKDAKVILLENIKSIGKDAILVDSKEAIKKASQISSEVATVARSNTYVTQKKVITETGTELGVVADIFFDDKTGQVEELNVTRGIKDIQSGQKRVPISEVVKVGEDATIVRSYTEHTFETQPPTGGVQGVAQSTASENAQQSLRQTADTAKNKAQNLIQQTQQKVSQVQQNPNVQQTTQEAKDVAKDVGAIVSAKAVEIRDSLKQNADKARDRQAETDQ